MSVDLDIAGGVAIVTLNRPEKLNAIDPPMRAELQAAWREVSTRGDLRACIVTGGGDRAFCVGSDLSATPAPETGPAAQSFGPTGPDHLLDGLDAGIPLIAAIRGYAIGGGLEIALACDIRIASDDAQFGLSEVRVGSMPGAGGTQRLPRIVGPSLAMHMMLTGERIEAARALAAGLVSELVSGDQLMARAAGIAERIARNAPLAVRAVKSLAQLSWQVSTADGLRMERLAFEAIRASADRTEGRAAFVEKRPPIYRGR
jgi:E-phenylitaconyl-CoA hydratase